MPLLDDVWIVFLVHHTVSMIIEGERGREEGAAVLVVVEGCPCGGE